MNRRWVVMGALAAVVLTASSHRARAEPFPLKQRYVAVALNGKPYDDRSRTLTLTNDPKLGFVIHAFAGCNYANLIVEFADGGRMTRKKSWVTARYCKPKMASERLYFDALWKMNRWRIESERLILAGDKDVLEFEAAAAR
jgi:heat shock protein HslJ